MPEPSLADISARLDRVEASLARVESALGRIRPATEPAPRAVADEAVVAAGAELAVAGVPQAAPPPEDPLSAIRAVLGRFFAAALTQVDAEAHGRLEALTHPTVLIGPRSYDHLRAFSWKKVRRTAERYVEGGRPDAFQIVRTVPMSAPQGSEDLKVFLASREGNPAPITLRRDDVSGGSWRVLQISL